MALVRKDLKIGFLAGALLLVLAVGYVLVLTFSGDPIDPPIASADPPAEDPSPLPAPPDPGGSTADDGILARSQTSPADDEWGVFGFDGKPPHVTKTPTGNPPALPDAPLEDAESDTPNLNEPEVVDPVGTIDGIASGSGTSPGSPLPQGPAPGGIRTHVVASGDNFSSIAARYYGDANLFTLIQKANPSVDSRRLKIGQKLLIPEQPAATETAPGGAIAPVTPSTGAAAGPAADGTYTVAAGDTLGGIAEKYLGRELLWKEIYKLNRDVIGDNPANLKVGMKLKLPK